VTCKVISFRFDRKTDYALLELTDPSVAEGLSSVPIDYGIEWRRVGMRRVSLVGYSGGVLRMNPSCEARIEKTRRFSG
jgi:hypothetical protein